MTDYWKFNTSSLDEMKFQSQQELTQKQKWRVLCKGIVGGKIQNLKLDPFWATTADNPT